MQPIKLLYGILVFMIATVAFLSFATAGETAFRIEGPDLIVDQAGRKIHVREPFKRVISLYGAHTENLFSLGLKKEIIGSSALTLNFSLSR